MKRALCFFASILLAAFALAADVPDRATFDAQRSSWPDGARIAEFTRLYGASNAAANYEARSAHAIRGEGGNPYARLTTICFGPRGRVGESCWIWIGGNPRLQQMRAK